MTTAALSPQGNVSTYVTDTATDTDALNGTDLERAPGPGVIQIWSASTVNTATMTATLAGQRNVARSLAIPLRTNGVPNVDQDPPLLEFVVGGGEKLLIALGGTTGTIYTIARWVPIG